MEGRARQLILAGALASSAWVSSVAGAPPPGAPAGDQIEEIQIIGERPGPRLWKVSRADHVLWVLGTFRHTPRKMVWRSSEVEAAVGASHEVLASVPSVSAGVGPIAMIRLYFQWRTAQKAPNRTALRDWLSPELYGRFEALKARYDPHDSGIEQLRPAFAALRLYEKAIDAAGLTADDEPEKAVLKLASRRRVPVRHAVLEVPDPSGTLKEASALPPSIEVSCLDATVARLETDLPAMQERARAWAVGDVDKLRRLTFPDQREACMNALFNSPRMKALFERAVAGWDAAAEAALANDRVSFAMRPIYDLLSPGGPLARFRAEGYTVEGP